MEAKDGSLDQFDRRMLSALAKDGRMTVAELARTLGLSKTPCAVRLKRLISEKYILGFRAILNPEKLDMSHVAFVEVKLENTKESALSAFNAAVLNVPEVEQCHMIAGAFDYLLKVRTKDIRAYRRVLGEDVSTLPHVVNTSTYVTMEVVRETPM